jgi:hypothetical protein
MEFYFLWHHRNGQTTLESLTHWVHPEFMPQTTEAAKQMVTKWNQDSKDGEYELIEDYTPSLPGMEEYKPWRP